MKFDVNGCSTCLEDSESYEEFYSHGKKRVQYDYRTPDGDLFSCIADNLTSAREKRERWLAIQSELAEARKKVDDLAKIESLDKQGYSCGDCANYQECRSSGVSKNGIICHRFSIV